ncbi:MAG: B12-binding domain-containing radical SAM protein [Deltaproteobacteria bacterium]|nr:B12-binding domain-containing radical SAM protein [Deltaproteobacteria bacterium]
MKLLIIYPSWPKLPGQTRFDLPPLGPIQAAACVDESWQVEVCDENVQPVDMDSDCDVLGLSIMLTCQAPRAYELAHAFRARGKKVLIGGLHVGLCPEEAAEHADSIVVGEAEGLIEQALADFQTGQMKPVYRREGFPDIAQVPRPRRELYDKKKYYSHKDWELVDLVETSRGCRFNCYPCCTPYLGGRQHRIKPIESVLADVDSCSDLMFIVDNSLEQNVEYQKELFRRLAGHGKHWVSHPISCDSEVLKLAREAGCWYVYHAVYNISDKIKDRIKMYHDHGIGVEGTILLGLDDHTEDFTKRFIDFLLTVELDLAEFTILTPFPHTEAYNHLEREGRIFDRDWRHYNAGHVVYEPKQMSVDTLQRLFDQAWGDFYRDESQELKMSKLFLQLLRSMPGRKRRGESQGTHS